MKTSAYVRILAVASVALAPFAAFGQETDVTQSCVNAFVAQHFPGQSPIINVSRESLRLPLALNATAIKIELKAASRDTGKLLATATCVAKGRSVKLFTNYTGATLAAR